MGYKVLLNKDSESSDGHFDIRPSPHHFVYGTAVKVIKEKKLLIIKFDSSPLEEVEVQVSLGDLDIDYTQKRIKGTLLQVKDGWRLENIWPADKILNKIESDINKQLRMDTVTRGRKVFRDVGEYIPKFALYNQNAELIVSDQLKGKWVVINFIFYKMRNA